MAGTNKPFIKDEDKKGFQKYGEGKGVGKGDLGKTVQKPGLGKKDIGREKGDLSQKGRETIDKKAKGMYEDKNKKGGLKE